MDWNMNFFIFQTILHSSVEKWFINPVNPVTYVWALTIFRQKMILFKDFFLVWTCSVRRFTRTEMDEIDNLNHFTALSRSRTWEKHRRVHRGGGGGSPLPMNPPRSFKFRCKINGMRAHCVRARFRDRSRPCFMYRIYACDVLSTFKDLIVAKRARPCCSGRRGTECAV